MDRAINNYRGLIFSFVCDTILSTFKKEVLMDTMDGDSSSPEPNLNDLNMHICFV